MTIGLQVSAELQNVRLLESDPAPKFIGEPNYPTTSPISVSLNITDHKISAALSIPLLSQVKKRWHSQLLKVWHSHKFLTAERHTSAFVHSIVHPVVLGISHIEASEVILLTQHSAAVLLIADLVAE